MKDKMTYDEYKRYSLRAAYELQYGEKILEQIRTAETSSEIERIMFMARQNY